MYEALRDLYDQLIDALKSDPPPKVRWILWYLARARLNQLLDREYANPKLKSFIGKISNGFESWFTFVIQPGADKQQT